MRKRQVGISHRVQIFNLCDFDPLSTMIFPCKLMDKGYPENTAELKELFLLKKRSQQLRENSLLFFKGILVNNDIMLLNPLRKIYEQTQSLSSGHTRIRASDSSSGAQGLVKLCSSEKASRVGCKVGEERGKSSTRMWSCTKASLDLIHGITPQNELWPSPSM